ncbi:D-alanyl-D-alanine carboxypeptidase [Synechococcus sp. H65.1]|uniref:D-alanyl-D-alanine carboxypeptidase n=1 Tax=unclassified Synechococcus TaxID=2626047 RepID=UPI0039C232DB
MSRAAHPYRQRRRRVWLIKGLVAIWGAMLSAALLLLGAAPFSQATAQGSLQPQVEAYLAQLTDRGFSAKAQGVWLQVGDQVLGQHQGSTPLPAASLTKVATTLAALQQFGPQHRFVTTWLTTGSLTAEGVLQGDLWVLGGEDPFFVWEEAFLVGNALNGRGIRQVRGDLVVVGRFYMNFSQDVARSGALLQQGLDARRWPPEAQVQFQTLPPGTPRPQVEILGSVRLAQQIPATAQVLLRHESPPLIRLLKLMNLYSNNSMAEMLAAAVGGAERVAQIARRAAGIPPAELQLVNGSGLGVKNRISPRANVALLQAIQLLLEKQGLSLADAFAVVGQDGGVLERRLLPRMMIAKSGTLSSISTLAGVLPTEKGDIWFALMNSGAPLANLRTWQEEFLSQLQSQWGAPATLPEHWRPRWRDGGSRLHFALNYSTPGYR